VKGRDQEEEAYRVYHRLMAAEGLVENDESPTVIVLCDLFLEFSKENHEADTYLWFKRFLQSFCNKCGTIEVAKLKPFHVNRWIAGHKWGQSSRAAAITCVKRAINWSVDEGYLKRNASPVSQEARHQEAGKDRHASRCEAACNRVDYAANCGQTTHYQDSGLLR